MAESDSGATMHPEFNKHVFKYTTNYTNPVTSGQIQDYLHNSNEKLSEDDSQA